MSAASSRNARAGIHSIDHFALEVPDLDEAERFYGAFGLRVERRADGLRLRATDSDHVWGRILAGPRKRLAYLALGCYENDFALLREQVLTAKGKPAEPYGQADDSGFWFHDQDGNLINVRMAAKTMPDAKHPLPDPNTPAGQRGACANSDAPLTLPRRLSHVLLFTPDIDRTLDFYQRGLGLNLSDRSRDIVAFMHARHGCDHHLIALAKSSAKGWHHSSWDVASLEAVGLGGMQMRRAGYPNGWGTGRHVLGSNYFHYVQDPWGSFCEYSADIDYVPAGTAWESGDFPPEDSLYLWGPDVPAYFIENTEL